MSAVNELVWSYGLMATNIVRIQRNDPGLKPYAKGSHDVRGKDHATDLYKVKMHDQPDVFLHWSFCPKCMEVRQEYLVGYDDQARLGHLRELIRNGGESK